MNHLSIRTLSTLNNCQLSTVVLAMALLFSGSHAIGAETKAATTVKPDASWSKSKKESKTFTYPDDNESEGPINCDANKVMVGREHDGDEQDPTRHKCASLDQHGPLTVNTSGTHEKRYAHEHEKYEFQCIGNGVMTGRGHWDDERGPTWYYCGTVKDAWGDDMQVGNRVWSAEFTETDSSYTCPSGMVMTGRGHWGDEHQKGMTKYQCATLY